MLSLFSNIFIIFIVYFLVPLNWITRGDSSEHKGKAFVIYEDIYDAKAALDHLNGFNVLGRYLIVLYYQHSKMVRAIDNAAKKKELDELKARFGMGSGTK